MKKQVQEVGVRKWFGDDWISIQDEIFAVLEGFFGSYGQQFILSGCTVSGNDISAGIVGLITGTDFRLCSFPGIQGTSWPVYLYPLKVTENRTYLDNQVKPICENWQAAISGNNPSGYFQLKQDGTSARFFDTIQTSTRRFVTDSEKTSYSAQSAAAITTIRGGVAADYDSLSKIVAAMMLKANLLSPALTGTPTAPTAATTNNSTQLATTAFVKAVITSLGLENMITANSPTLTGTPTAPTAAINTNTTQIANTAFVQAAIAALVSSSPAALDTLNELAAALGNDANFSTTITNALANKLNRNFDNVSNIVGALTALNVEGSTVLTGTDIDWSGKPIRTKTLTTATTLTFSNLIVNKTITLKVTGVFTLILPTSVSQISGTYDGSKVNLIQFLCIDSITPEVWCVISQKV